MTSPYISVVLPTYNRAGLLERSLSGLVAQQGIEPHEYEIIVVDNHSTDHTAEVAKKIAGQASCNVIYCFEAKPGKVFALNTGIQKSKGHILCFTDDDCIIDPHWLVQIRHCFANYPCDALGGRILRYYEPGVTYPDWVVNDTQKLNGALGRHDWGEETRPYDKTMEKFYGANIAILRDVLNECGNFSEYHCFDARTALPRGGEDAEMFDRLRAMGKQVFYAGKVLIHHPVDRNECTLRHLAHYAMSQGPNLVVPITADTKMLLGVPRWVYRDILANFARLMRHGLSREKWLGPYLGLFYKLGTFVEYRRLARQRTAQPEIRPATHTDK